MTKANNANVKPTHVALHNVNGVTMTTTKEEFIKRGSSSDTIDKYLEENGSELNDEFMPLSSEDTDEEIDIEDTTDSKENMISTTNQDDLNNVYQIGGRNIVRKLSEASEFALSVENDITPEEMQLSINSNIIINNNPIPPPPPILTATARYSTKKKSKKNEPVDVENIDDKIPKKIPQPPIAVRTRSSIKKVVEASTKDKDEEIDLLRIPPKALERTVLDKEPTPQEEEEMLQELVIHSETRLKMKRSKEKSPQELEIVQAVKEHGEEDSLQSVQDSEMHQTPKRKERILRVKAHIGRPRKEDLHQEESHQEDSRKGKSRQEESHTEESLIGEPRKEKPRKEKPLRVESRQVKLRQVKSRQEESHKEKTPILIAPKVIAPEAIAPEAIALEAIAPEVIAPEAIASEVIAPEVTAPKAIAPESSKAIAPKTARVPKASKAKETKAPKEPKASKAKAPKESKESKASKASKAKVPAKQGREREENDHQEQAHKDKIRREELQVELQEEVPEEEESRELKNKSRVRKSKRRQEQLREEELQDEEILQEQLPEEEESKPLKNKRKGKHRQEQFLEEELQDEEEQLLEKEESKPLKNKRKGKHRQEQFLEEELQDEEELEEQLPEEEESKPSKNKRKGKRRQGQSDEEDEYQVPVPLKKVRKGKSHKEVNEGQVYKERLRRGRPPKSSINEDQETKEIILLDDDEEEKEKNIPNKKNKKKNKPITITLPLNTTTSTTHPSPPSPVNTITRSNSIRNDSPIEKSNNENGQSSSTKNITAAMEITAKHSKQLEAKDLVVTNTVLGEGQIGIVNLARYRGLLVACKSKRNKTRQEPFYYQIQRELKYAADLSVCRYINRYFGWIYCSRDKVEEGVTNQSKKLYVVQKYIANGDARSYLNGRDSTFQTYEAIQASICLFSALTDVHALGIGLVDLKLENFLIDSSGAGWLTDFGSCIEFYGRDEVDLDEEEVAWTTSVAAPEMIRSHYFSKASDVFMATLVVAELLTVSLSDNEFYNTVLRRRKSGDVSFSSAKIQRKYSCLIPILQKGLANNSKDRPSASDILRELINIRREQSKPTA